MSRAFAFARVARRAMTTATTSPVSSSSSSSSSSLTSSSALSIYIETYGCQMNTNDSDIVRGILRAHGHGVVNDASHADVVLLNTCAVREGAEQKIWARLAQLKAMKTSPESTLRAVGVLGCMAERLKSALLRADGLADIVCGPDAYRDVPRLLANASRATSELTDDERMNVLLSLDETYADVTPVRRDPSSPLAYVSVMRGCDNMCSFCVVPFTRGRERSRALDSIVRECRDLVNAGVKEITLLGQNVNSYADKFSASAVVDDLGYVVGDDAAKNANADPFAPYAKGFKSVYKPDARRRHAYSFADLVAAVAAIDREVRVRFTSPHPKDFPDDLLRVVAETPNVCKQLHMPAQSGSTTTLARMRRGYTREAYVDLITRTREMIPGVAISSDFISGFCGETEAEHAETISLLERVRFETAYMFHYSLRDKTHAARHLSDDVPEDVKKRRLAEVIDTFRAGAARANAEEIGRTHLVLVEGVARKSDAQMSARSDTGKRVIIEGRRTVRDGDDAHQEVDIKPGDYVIARIERAGPSTLIARPLGVTTATRFFEQHGAAWHAAPPTSVLMCQADTTRAPVRV